MIAQLAAAVGLTPATFVVTAVIFAVIAALFLFTRAPEKVDTDAPFPPQATISDYGNVPESQYTSTDGTADIPTRFAEEGIASAEECPEMTIPQLFQKAVDAKPDQIALRVERLNEDGKPDRDGVAPALVGGKAPPALPADQWVTWSFREYNEECRNAAKAFMALGMEQHDAVTIFGFNAPEWMMSEIAAIFAGGKAAGIYPTDTVDQVEYKVVQSGASIVCLDDAAKVDKFAELVKANRIPDVKAVITWAAEPSRSQKAAFKKGGCDLMTWAELMELGAKVSDEELDDRQALISPGHCCGLIYTSGTTGAPKAVMISHDNIIFESRSAMQVIPHIGAKPEQERVISYLPLSHVAGMMVDIVMPMCITADKPGWVTTSYARPYDLKASSIGDRLKSVKPTIFLGVPRVWEKIAEKMKAIGKSTKGLKLVIAKWAKGKGLKHANNMQLGGSGAFPGGYGIAEKLVLKKVKEALGLQCCKFGFTGAAPITTETLSYFGALGIQINEVYGMSECTGATTFSTDRCHIWGSCGFTMPGCEVKILDEKNNELPRAADIFNAPEGEQGEICFRGRHIMMGYLAQPKMGKAHVKEIKQKLADAIDQDGWLHSGDKGCMGQNGFVKITGRYKELIIGAGGENIAPVPIEDNIKKLCPGVSNVMMIGDKRKFNVAIVTLKAVGATGELPGGDELQPDGAGICSSGVQTISAARDDETCIAAITAAIAATNKDGSVCPSNAAKVQKFTILRTDFSVTTEELTPTLKLKRSVVEKMHADLIEHMYKSKETYINSE